MRKVPRFAQDIFRKWKTDTVFQDAFETGVGAVVSAGGQLIFTDMSPEEIAISSIIGGAGAMMARPVAAKAGFALGRALDKPVGRHFDRLMDDPWVNGMWGLSGHKGMERVRKGTGLPQFINDMPEEARRGALELLEAKNKLNYIRPDGSKRTELEGFLGKYGRSRGDNIVQGAIAIGTPFVIGNSGSETDETGMSYGSV